MARRLPEEPLRTYVVPVRVGDRDRTVVVRARSRREARLAAATRAEWVRDLAALRQQQSGV